MGLAKLPFLESEGSETSQTRPGVVVLQNGGRGGGSPDELLQGNDSSCPTQTAAAPLPGRGGGGGRGGGEQERRTRRRPQKERRRKAGCCSRGRDGRYTERNLPLVDGAKPQTLQASLGHVGQGPEVRSVPLQLLSTLRLRTFEADAKRVRRRDLRVTHSSQCNCRAPSHPCSLVDLWQEVELHDPAVCSACEQEQASLALKTFIWRKKTQLHMQTLKGRLNTHPSSRDRAGWRSLCKKSPQSHLMPLTGFGRDYSVKICGSQQPGVTVATSGGTWSCPGNR
ncbi:uncharacterized protein LOC133012263 [Limanda limanda]|uniref:uncharacterized protein LOC133012263 n=1 Tax=Limanda limanda TaxID=27771 RepID=UPI0029C8A824|nr:uncharacterized protein LOC133012263 [Limanda limanda]